MLKLYRFTTLLITILFVSYANAQVIINEYSCANFTAAGNPDFFGEMEDWVELYNMSSSAVNLNGYYLSDKTGNPTKFQVSGNISIPAGGYLMVYASGRAQVVGTSEIHTNFKLTQTKSETILLSDPSGVLVDSVTIVPNQLLHSRGRTTDGSGAWSLFTSPTPSGSNVGAQLEYATKPTFSLAAGFFTSAQSITIITPDPNITIRYTTDGSDPSGVSPIYSGPINIATTTVLRARCFSSTPNIPASFIETNTYFINVTHTVPVISICGNDLQTLLDGTQIEPEGSLEFFGRDGILKAEVTGDFNKHGNDSWAYPQRGVDFIARDQYGYNHSVKHKIFPNKSRKQFQRLILKAGASDNYPFEGQANSNYFGELGGAHIRDAYVQSLSQSGDLLLDERTYDANVLYLNGQYWGLYETREKVDDSDFLEYYYEQSEQYKDSPNYIQYLATWGGTNQEYGAPNAQIDWNNFVSFVTGNNMAIQANFDIVTSQFKWKSLVDYMVLNSYIVNQDMLNWNTSWWRGLDTNGEKLKWRYTLWDMDATFNHYVNFSGINNSGPTADPCQIDHLPNLGGQGHIPVLNALLNNPTFRQYYVSRYIDLSNTTFKCTNMIAVLDSLVNMITPEMPGQIAKWGGTIGEWQTNVQDLRNFINARCAALNQGLIGCYNVTGPYPLKVNVVPSGAGDAQINSVIPTNYVYSGNYFGNIDILLKATENTGYVFDHWEVFNHVLDSSINNKENSLQITQEDSIVAHFILEPDTVDLTFNVDPVGGGDITIDGFTPTSYSYTDAYPEMSVLNLVAIPQPGYIFINWTSNSTLFNASPNDSSVQITVDLMDSIVAHFALLDSFEITFEVNPFLKGEILIDTNTMLSTTTTLTQKYITGTLIELTQTPISNFLFDHWETDFHTLTPSTLSDTVSFNVAGNDVIQAIYIEEVIPPSKGIAVPQAFSPNQDGNNDVLYVYGGAVSNMSFNVFNRWGELVFSSASLDRGWDGSFKGEPASTGVYVYTLKATFTDDESITKTGNVTLIR